MANLLLVDRYTTCFPHGGGAPYRLGHSTRTTMITDQHLPGVEPSSWHASRALHALPYVTPSLPQTSSTSSVQNPPGLGLQVHSPGVEPSSWHAALALHLLL
jgi:hypothetical protein